MRGHGAARTRANRGGMAVPPPSLGFPLWGRGGGGVGTRGLRAGAREAQNAGTAPLARSAAW